MQLKSVVLSFVFLIGFAGSNTLLAQANKPKVGAKAAVKVMPAQKVIALATPEEIEEGRVLIAKSDCVACHNAENKMVGPSYISITQKYPLTEANVNHLAQKVVTGGSGVWGEIPMPPHPAAAPADVRKMVKYILSLKAK